MVDDLYSDAEYRINQIGSGATLFVTALAVALIELELLPPEERTATSLVALAESIQTILGEQESVTAEARVYAQSLLDKLSDGIQQMGPLFPPGGDS